MKKSIFALIAISFLVTVSCTKEKQNNRLTNDNTIYGKVIPHISSINDTDEIYIMSTFPSYQWAYYNATFGNYKDFEDSDVVGNGRVLERGIICTPNSTNPTKERLQVGEIDSTINHPYTPIMKHLHKSNAAFMIVYYIRYYAELDNGKIVYSGILNKN